MSGYARTSCNLDRFSLADRPVYPVRSCGRFDTGSDVRIRRAPASDASQPVSEVINGSSSVDAVTPRQVLGTPVFVDRIRQRHGFKGHRALLVYRVAISVQDHHGPVAAKLDTASQQSERHIALEDSGVAFWEGHRGDHGVGCFEPVVRICGAERTHFTDPRAPHEPLDDIDPMRH